MSDKSEQGLAAITLAFLDAFARDHDAEQPRSLAQYQALWPGYETIIAEEYHAAIRDVEAEAKIENAARDRIAQYRIEEEIGRGAQGTVYRAHDENLDRTVALKVFRRVLSDGVRARLRFQREARAASRLDHPGICTVFESGVEGNSAFMAMRYVSGSSLAERIANSDTPPSGKELRETVELIAGAAKALHAAHEAGVLHRDLKPGNLMITPDGDAVILDFGLAGGLDTGLPSLTATGDIFGTPAYMPPEQVRDGSGSLERNADVYALGVTLYEAVTLQRPFPGDNLEVLYSKILAGDKPDARSLNPAISRDLSVVIDTAIDPLSDRRYQTAAQFAEDLRRVTERKPILARPTPRWLRSYRWMERNPVAATSLCGMLIVIVTAFGILPSLIAESPADRADRMLGIDTRKDNEVEDLLRRGFQISFGANPLPARALFDQALHIDPANPTALAGRVLVEMPMTAAALDILDRADDKLLHHGDVLWLRGVVLKVAGREQEAEQLLARAGDATSDLRAFLQGHFAARNFMPPIVTEEVQQALAHFKQAVMRSSKPRFHHYHSMLMAAERAGNSADMAEAERALIHHWPDAQATWEAVAQFYLPSDPKKGVAALHRILELGPSATAHLGLATHSENIGDTAEALRHYRDAIATDDEMASAYLMQGNFQRRLGQTDDALQSYVDALRTAQGFVMPICADTLLRALAALSDFERTLTTLDALVMARPDLRNVLRESISEHFAGEDFETCLEILRK